MTCLPNIQSLYLPVSLFDLISNKIKASLDFLRDLFDCQLVIIHGSSNKSNLSLSASVCRTRYLSYRDQLNFFPKGSRPNQHQTKPLRANSIMIPTNISLGNVSRQIPGDTSSQTMSSSSLPITMKSLAGLVKMNRSPNLRNTNAHELTPSVSSSSSDECESQVLSDWGIHLDGSQLQLCPTLGFDSPENVKEGFQSKQHQALDDTTRDSQITLVQNKRFLSNGHRPLRQSNHSRVARSKTSDVVTRHPMKRHTLFIQLKDRSPQTASIDESPSRSPSVSLPHKTITTPSSSPSRTISSGQIRPQNHISRDVAIELMSQFLDEFSHLYTDSEACALLKKCGDWTLLFEVSTLKSQEFFALECFEGEDLEDQKRHSEQVMAMVWDEEEDDVLLIPERKITSQDRIRLQVIKKRKGLQAIANRRVFLNALKKK
ncbi:hypothetical protein DFH28DRAFT_392837 [Melampsora americana]|nr:hypothetical protein DFH28DRAFT_392837 [Melampsora americana]